MDEIISHTLGLEVIVVAAAIYQFWRSLLGLRAKERLHTLIYHSAGAEMRTYIQHAKNLSDEEVAIAARRLEEAAKALSETDRGLLKEGLHQPSRVGLKRYVSDILSAA
jgi:hypothetical protein